MGYYPIFVEMEHRRVLLVGGGNVAREKIGKLLDAGADVTVVAPELSPEVREYVESGRVHLLARPYRHGDIEGSEMVFVATNDGAVNGEIADEARAHGVWVNAADDASNCDFILPSLATRGTIAIATSTAGTSPALARWLRERMEEFLTDDVVALGDLLAETRKLVRVRDRECADGCSRARTPPPLLCETCPNRIQPDRWQQAIGDDLLPLLHRGEHEQAKQQLIHALDIDQPLLARAAP